MNTQQLFWKYAEGTCNPAETAAVEKQLADNPSLQIELDSILEVQSVLVSMEAEAPSMRFTQNVMDALPAIYPNEVADPLVKPVWKKVFWIAVAILIAGLFLVPRSSQPKGDLLSPYMDQVTSGISNILGQIPGTVMQYFVLTLLSVGLLMILDKVFLKRVRGLIMI